MESKTREETLKEYRKMSLLTLWHIKNNESYVAGVIDTVINEKIKTVQSALEQIEHSGELITTRNQEYFKIIKQIMNYE